MNLKMSNKKSKGDTKVTMIFYQGIIIVSRSMITGRITLIIRNKLLKSTQNYKMTNLKMQ